jgi:hypothetical protein
MRTSASTAARLFAECDREARGHERRRKEEVRRRVGAVLRERHALEYLLSPGDPAAYHDREAMADALATLAGDRRSR